VILARRVQRFADLAMVANALMWGDAQTQGLFLSFLIDASRCLLTVDK